MILPKIRSAASTLLRKFRSITERQWKISGLVFLALMAAGPIWFLIYDLLGRKAWKDYEAAERARGTKLNIVDFAELNIPDEENFAALPIFKNPLNLQQRLPDFPRGRPRQLATPEIGQPFQPEAWQKYFAKAGWIDTPSEDVAGDLRLALIRYEDALNELTTGLNRRRCSFNTPWAPNPFQTPHPCRELISRATLVAGLRAHVSLSGGDSAAALRDLDLIVGIYERLTSQDCRTPSSFDFQIRLASYEPSIVYEGLSRHAWKAAQLRQIIALLELSDPLSDLAYRIEIRRAMANGAFEWVLTGNVPGANEPIPLDPAKWFQDVNALRKFPGILRRNQLVLNRYFATLRNRIDLDLRTISGPLSKGIGVRMEGSGPYYSISRQLVIWRSEIDRHLTSAARFRLASTACALELYYQKHSVYPRDLADLVPEFLPAIPHEPTSMESLVYYPTDDGRYRLYSRGADGEDYDGRTGWGSIDYQRDYNPIDVPWTAPPAR